jgi:hypothetical protein
MLLSDLIQSSGVLIQARWAYLGRVEPGKACWVQGAMVQIHVNSDWMIFSCLLRPHR